MCCRPVTRLGRFLMGFEVSSCKSCGRVDEWWVLSECWLAVVLTQYCANSTLGVTEHDHPHAIRWTGSFKRRTLVIKGRVTWIHE